MNQIALADPAFREARPPAGGHKSVEWYTPKWIFDELGITFDLDPSSPHDYETFVPCDERYTVFDDGLSKPWFGRVWLNPPFGPDVGFWVRRMIDHGNGIALVFSRTDAAWCQEAMQSASAILFLAGRVEFVPGHENQHKKSRSGAGTVLFAFGDECAVALERLSRHGVYIIP
ncbi:MAG: bacteriophage DNA methylase [Marinobacter sp. T13-3]|nr:MAG: bacteriophage DNA methylase [Marinobacter sp. T13-3]